MYLVRHAESVGNAAEILQGQRDYGLSSRGRMQASRLAERFSGIPLVAIYSSPLARARETARLIARRPGLAVVEEPGLLERAFGAGEGLTRQELLRLFPEIVARKQREETAYYPGEESRDSFQRRVVDSIRAMVERHPDGDVLAVTHAGPISAYCLAVLAMPFVRPVPFVLENASVTVVEHRDGVATIETMNDTCQLRGLA